MNLVATIALACWPIVVAIFFLTMPVSRAAVRVYILAWLFLPLIQINVPGAPDYGKFTATGLALLVWLPVFGHRELTSLRLHWYDLPMVVWCLSPFFTSLTNQLGFYDGLTGSFTQALLYAVPYVVGRLFLRTSEDWRAFARFLVVAALFYMPLCFYEIRMSPQLHRIVYGVSGRLSFHFMTTLPFCYYSPAVFMNSTFEVVAMYAATALISFWAWRTGARRFVRLLPNSVLFCSFSLITIMSQKMTGIGLLALGVSTLALVEQTKRKWIAITLAIIPAVYMTLFSLSIWQGTLLGDIVENIASSERALSVQFRLDNDTALLKKAMQRPLLGWGGWGRNRVYDDKGRDISTTDSMWMITLGSKGAIGLLAQTALYALPIIFFLIACPSAQWKEGTFSIVLPFVAILGLQLCNNLFNAFPSAIYPMIAGGVLETTWRAARQRSARKPSTMGPVDDVGRPPRTRTIARKPSREAESPSLDDSGQSQRAETDSQDLAFSSCYR